MDLFAPCRSCLQCLPFFHLSPPARVTAPAPSPSPHSSDAYTSVDPAQASKSLPSPNPAAAPAVQEQDLCPPLKAEEKPQDVYSVITECEAVPPSGIVIAPPVTSPHSSPSIPEDADDDKATNLPELPLHVPYINDITFSGSLPLQSPVTPAPFGPGYPANQYPPPGPPQYQIVHEQRIGRAQHVLEDPQHADEKSCHDDASAEHEHSHSHHGHDHSHHGHVNPEDGHVPPQYQIIQEQSIGHAQHVLEDPQHADEKSCHDHASAQHEHSHSHHGHDHSHHEHVNSEDGHVPQHSHVHAVADYEVPADPDPPSDDSQSIQELHKDAVHDDSQRQSHDSTSVDDVGEMATEHTSFDDKIDNISPTPHLEVTQSTPELDLEATVGGESSSASFTNGASALLETYHSEPVVVVSGNPHDIDDVESPSELLGHGGSQFPARRRRRDHFKNNLKGFKQQIKQGGLHLKEEGNKHMQTIIENMNKQAQQIEQSGSFLIVPRANNN